MEAEEEDRWKERRLTQGVSPGFPSINGNDESLLTCRCYSGALPTVYRASAVCESSTLHLCVSVCMCRDKLTGI